MESKACPAIDPHPAERSSILGQHSRNGGLWVLWPLGYRGLSRPCNPQGREDKGHLKRVKREEEDVCQSEKLP